MNTFYNARREMEKEKEREKEMRSPVYREIVYHKSRYILIDFSCNFAPHGSE